MPELSNPQHELFAQARAAGASCGDAALAAGYASAANGGRLSSRPDIKARILEIATPLRVPGLNASNVTMAHVVDRLIAIAENKKEPATARVRCLHLIGLHLGGFEDIVRHRGDADEPISVVQRTIVEAPQRGEAA